MLGVVLAFVAAQDQHGTERDGPIQPDELAMIGATVGHSTAVLSVSSDYGKALSYYGFTAGSSWATPADVVLAALSGHPLPAVKQRFRDHLDAGADFLVVTDIAQWRAEDELRALVTTQYPVSMRGPGHIVFDLRRRLAGPSS